jgi:pimeloyl-ACP methyl ester carboxylesterase
MASTRTLFTWLALCAVTAQASAQDTTSVTQALATLGRVAEVARESQPGWQWQQVQVFDETYPLTVDIVASSDSTPRAVIYFFPGGGTNFHQTFFTPHAENLAQYFRERGYLVVGITPRAESVPAGVKDQRFALGWGLAKQRADARSVIEVVQRAIALPYEVLGHSYGGSLALDYGANFSAELQRLTILDIYAFDPAREPEAIRNARRTHFAYVQLLALGVHLEDMGSNLGDLANWSAAERSADSGLSRSLVSDYRGNFTNESLYFYGLIETGTLPGAHTLFSGLRFDWPMRRGIFAGEYTFADNPRDDTFTLTHVDEATLAASSQAVGSGLVPSAYSRDYWAAVAGNSGYTLDWTRIQCPFLWVNTEYGYGEQFYGALAARAAGNSDVTTHVVAGYGHSDIFIGRNARSEVWPLLNP